MSIMKVNANAQPVTVTVPINDISNITR